MIIMPRNTKLKTADATELQHSLRRPENNIIMDKRRRANPQPLLLKCLRAEIKINDPRENEECRKFTK